MFDFFEEVIKDPRGAEILMMSKVTDAMRKVLETHFDNLEGKDHFICKYARELNLDYNSISPLQPCLFEQIADRIKTRLITLDIFDDHFIDGDYKNFKEARNGARRDNYSQWNEESEIVRRAENPEIDGRDYPPDPYDDY